MLRFLAISITLSAALLLAGFWAYAQDPNATLAQPTFTKPVPAAVPPVQYPPGAGPVLSNPYAVRSIGPNEFRPIADDATLNRDRELNREATALVAKYSQATDAKDKAEIEKALAKTVADHFTLRQDIREKELLDLEEQLKRLRAVHQQRTAEKDRIVTDRVQHLLRDASGLGWGNDGSSPRTEYTNLNNIYSAPVYSTPRVPGSPAAR